MLKLDEQESFADCLCKLTPFLVKLQNKKLENEGLLVQAQEMIEEARKTFFDYSNRKGTPTIDEPTTEP